MPGGSFSDSLLVARLRSCWRLKALLAAALCTFFCVPYFLVGNFPILPVHELALSPIDRAIGFHPAVWVWIYQSEYLLVNFVPWLAEERAELMRYARGFAILSVVSFAVFVIYPIRAPKPQVADAGGMYWLLQLYDVPLNSFPSLHAALVIYTVRFAHRIGLAGRKTMGLLLWTWAVLILYGTLATKEHYFIDIVAGVLLAVAADAWVWRSQAAVSASFAASAALPKSFSSSESTAGVRR